MPVRTRPKPRYSGPSKRPMCKGFFAFGVLGLAGTLLLGCSASAASDGGAIDYLVQDVCLDAQGRAVQGDPASCNRRRDLRIGEPQRYILTDRDRASGVTFQASSSIPVRGTDGSLMILLVKNLEGSFGPNYRFTWSPARDAFDLVDVTKSGFASIVRTFDGGCQDQALSRNGSRKSLADRAGGWILFPLRPAPSAWPPFQSRRLTTWRMQITPRKGACADNQATGLTSWTKPARYPFESGKVMSAIRSDHFAAADLSQAENSFERTYFTREYGLTRWEAWQTLAYCQRTLGQADPRCRPTDPANPWFGRCTALTEQTTGIAGVARIGGQIWVRMFCRDQTHYIPLNRPQLFLSPSVGRGSAVLDVDYAGTVAAAGKP